MLEFHSCLRRTLLAAATMAVADLPVAAHVHLQIGWRDGRWDLYVYDFDAGRSEASETPFQVTREARTRVPDGSAFTSILGLPGTSVWILPQIENPALLHLGIGTSQIPNGMFRNDRVRLSLHKVEGPGTFVLFSTGAFGQPVVHLTSLDGVEPSQDRIDVPAVNGHLHFNWAFTASGVYRLGFAASGQLSADGEWVQGAVVEYTFLVEGPPPPRLGGPRFTSDGLLALWVESDPAEVCQILDSADLTHWRVITNLANPEGLREVFFPAPEPADGSPRFWRAQIP